MRARPVRRPRLLAALCVLLVGAATATVGVSSAQAAPVPHVPVVTVSPANPTVEDAVTVTSTITGCAGAEYEPVVFYLVQGPYPSLANARYGPGAVSDGGDTYTVSVTLPPGSLLPGPHTAESYGGATPCYDPTAPYGITYSARVPFTVGTATEPTAVTASSPGSHVVGQDVLVDVVVDSATATGPVTVSEDGAELGAATVTAGAAQVDLGSLPTGVHELVASYGGDATHDPSVSAPFPVTVVRAAAPLTVAATPVASLVGDEVALDVTGPAGADGTYTVTEGATVLSSDDPLTGGTGQSRLTDLAAGPHDLVVTYSGSTEYEASTADVHVDVALRPTTTSVTADRAGTTLTLTATVTPDPDWADDPEGSVRFTDGATALGEAVLAGGTARLVVSAASVGTHSVAAHYLGDAVTGPSDSAAVSTVVPGLTVPGTAVAGHSLRVRATGFAASSEVAVLLDGVQLAAVVTDADGAVDSEVVLPTTAAGLRTLTLLGEDAAGAPVSLEQDVTVSAAVVPPVSTPVSLPPVATPVAVPVSASSAATPVTAAGAAPTSATLARTGPAEPAPLLLLSSLSLLVGALLVTGSRRRTQNH